MIDICLFMNRLQNTTVEDQFDFCVSNRLLSLLNDEQYPISDTPVKSLMLIKLSDLRPTNKSCPP